VSGAVGAEAIAVTAALGAAAVTALGTAMQQRATQAAPAGEGLHLPLLVALARTPLWWGGVAATLVGFALYLLSLVNGALILAQPIMISGLIFGSVFAAWLARRRVDRQLLAGGVVCGGGLVLFLAVARPTGGADVVLAARDGLTLAVVLGGTLLAAAVVAVRADGLARALALAVATAVLFGINAALVKLVADQLTVSWWEPLRQAPCYAMLLTAPSGVVLSQRAMQLGRLLAPVNAVISTLDPLTAVLIGILALGERMNTAPGAVGVELAAGAVVLIGIGVVSRRAARLIEADRTAEATGRAVPSWG
jgi:drug/metabolite transporter (DMT)-like permease